MPSSIHVAAHTGAEGRAPGHMGLVTTAPLWGLVPGPNKSDGCGGSACLATRSWIFPPSWLLSAPAA